ncbi:DUF222 domain-containing protein [Arthrobacter sp. SLBN-100]|uniref:DUF222 domain-containing protein n=1 Tax=Arthrobacter sp. SLBN-100 TaxID=2768450 RepID=UPI001F214EA6|nr:DUF222 domain-containing protein [Arthrobacter sp. SLBN-100]
MEVIGERPEQFGGNVVVLGRVGITNQPDASDSNNYPAAGTLGSLAASDGDDDATRLSAGWPLRAVPAGPVPAESAPAGSGPTESELVDSAPEASAQVEATPPEEPPTAVAERLDPASLPAGTVVHAGEPLSLGEIGKLLACAAAAAPSMLAGADYVEAAKYAGQVEELSRGVEYLQVLSAGTVDRTRTRAIAAADAARASRSRTGKGWVTGWDNGVETLNETDTAWPGQPAAPGSTASAAHTETEAGIGAGTGTGTATGSQGPVITSPADDGCANTAEFLRQRLRIGKSEANRRLALATDILPATTLTGDTIPAPREHLAAALTPQADGEESTGVPLASSRAGTIIALTLNRLQHLTTPEKLALIEQNLTTTAATADPDFLARVARRWADTIDADGTEPSEEALRHTQGAFIRKPRHGLHHLEIYATTDQYEHLLTVMNTATNPRTTGTANPSATGTTPAAATGTNGGINDGGNAEKDRTSQDGVWNKNNPGPDLDRRTRPQKQLEGLVGAAKVALATNSLPATGGNRPQIIATINYQDLLPHHTSTPAGAHPGAWTGGEPGAAGIEADAGTGTGTGIGIGTEARTGTQTSIGTQTSAGTGTGNFAFTGPIAAVTLRKIACDADIIPAILGTHGELLDLGRKTRLFTPAQRTALTARDQGCAFPHCTIPAPWCEAHHITYWSQGGPTNLDNGVLLCSGHHHLIHKEQWTITTTNGTPWFTPPKHLDPHQTPQQNHYFKPPPPPTPRE